VRWKVSIPACAVFEKEEVGSVGTIESSVSRIVSPEEMPEHPARRTHDVTRREVVRRVRVRVIMGVFDGIVMNSARIFG
jgi:hypothetical protein